MGVEETVFTSGSARLPVMANSPGLYEAEDDIRAVSGVSAALDVTYSMG